MSDKTSKDLRCETEMFLDALTDVLGFKRLDGDDRWKMVEATDHLIDTKLSKFRNDLSVSIY